MGCFADRVVLDAKATPKGPLYKDFSAANWTRSWKELHTDEVDDRLFRSGLWIGARWSALHRYKADLERMVAPLNPKRQVLAWLNEQAGRQISHMLRKFELLLDAGEQISITKMARDLTHDNTPSDGLLVLIGDAVKRVVEDYGFEIVDDYISNSYLIPRLGRVFINESQLVHRWEECKRLGCWVEEKNNVSIFLHPNSDYLISAAVALDHRHHDEAQIWNIVSQVSRLHANRRPREGVPVVSRASMTGGKLFERNYVVY